MRCSPHGGWCAERYDSSYALTGRGVKTAHEIPGELASGVWTRRASGMSIESARLAGGGSGCRGGQGDRGGGEGAGGRREGGEAMHSGTIAPVGGEGKGPAPLRVLAISLKFIENTSRKVYTRL